MMTCLLFVVTSTKREQKPKIVKKHFRKNLNNNQILFKKCSN